MEAILNLAGQSTWDPRWAESLILLWWVGECQAKGLVFYYRGCRLKKTTSAEDVVFIYMGQKMSAKEVVFIYVRKRMSAKEVVFTYMDQRRLDKKMVFTYMGQRTLA